MLPLNQILQASSSKEAESLCEKFGGHFLYNESGTGDIEYGFVDNLFISNCVIYWNEFEFRFPIVKSAKITAKDIPWIYERRDLHE